MIRLRSGWRSADGVNGRFAPIQHQLAKWILYSNQPRVGGRAVKDNIEPVRIPHIASLGQLVIRQLDATTLPAPFDLDRQLLMITVDALRDVSIKDRTPANPAIRRAEPEWSPIHHEQWRRALSRRRWPPS